MNDTARTPATWHFWAVAIVSMLWNLFGAYDYVMTRLRVMDYLQAATGNAEAMLQWIDSMPLWAQVVWPIGIWGSVAGSFLLLIRSRLAATAFLTSLVGAVLSFAQQLAGGIPAEFDTPAMKVMPVIILGSIVFFWWYSRRAAARGILR